MLLEPGDQVAIENALGTPSGTPQRERSEVIPDRETLVARVGGNAALLGAMAALFLDECPGYISGIRRAVAGRDAPALERAAHALRGAVSNFAAEPTAQAAQRLEQMGREGDLARSGQALRELEDELERLRPLLEGLK
jgi:HPt (histidine-containing phosphotransfer) domain-containing protein